MPRQERLHSATGIYHVMLRGINKQDIFEDDEDYIQFLKILKGLVVRHDDDGHVLPAHCTFYAYCPTELQRLGKKERNTILKQLCEYGANIRQISRVTGISYGVIYRAKSGS